MENVLIADDDLNFLRMIAKRLEKSNERFSPVFVKDGKAALNIIKKRDIDLVVSDLQMPNFDGYELLDFVKKNCPDIPVIIMTGFGRPKLKSLLTDIGAAGYFEKPVNYEELIEQINGILEKQSDGGILKSSSLEMFTQLVEMEQKTCTIRVKKDGINKKGVLFFKEGDLLSARVGSLIGLEAAHQIFSWQDVTLYIENECREKNKTIKSDLQAVLLESMRLRDENGAKEESENDYILDDDQDIVKGALKSIPIEDFSKAKGVYNVYTDSSWDSFIEKAREIGGFFETGNLTACYIRKKDSKNFIILPDKEPIVMDISDSCNKEDLINKKNLE